MLNLGKAVRVHGWRVAVVVAGLGVAAFDAGAGLFGMVPIVLWCLLARSWRTGVAVGLVLVVLLAWFVVPRALGWSGPWVPSALESFCLHPVMAAVVCEAGVLVERRRPAGVGWLLGTVGLGLLATAWLLLMGLEAKPRDEGVLPGPAGLRVAEGTGWCGSGNCSRDLEATGDRAADVMREHLVSRGYVSRPPYNDNELLCRTTGLVVTHEVCAELRNVMPRGVEVVWYVQRPRMLAVPARGETA
ncbi:hypothetical protein SAMN05216188_107236 [Lentzea xinjiangensis]|uniref:Uncharacterized protein n=1 Tax=Lentzea xinjiangensis TaxID=402600 RepID=A0A1H9L473_9PSEU|nr:hypothetical protein [Lentzea xinjiangensis]SER05937.1 hypothetical protein SAMN05216188_107236 [Lentzea xinjiangensis]